MDFRTGDEAAMGLDQADDTTIDREVGDREVGTAGAKLADTAVKMTKSDKGSDELVADKANAALTQAVAAAAATPRRARLS